MNNFVNAANNQNMNNFVNAANNQNMNNFANVANNQNMNNFVNVANNQNIGQNTNNQNINSASTTQGDPNSLNLIFNSQGSKITIQAKKDARFCEVATKFANKAGVLDKKISFIIFSESVKKECTKTLEELKLKNYNTIEVIFDSEVIGA